MTPFAPFFACCCLEHLHCLESRSPSWPMVPPSTLVLMSLELILLLLCLTRTWFKDPNFSSSRVNWKSIYLNRSGTWDVQEARCTFWRAFFPTFTAHARHWPLPQTVTWGRTEGGRLKHTIALGVEAEAGERARWTLLHGSTSLGPMSSVEPYLGLHFAFCGHCFQRWRQ